MGNISIDVWERSIIFFPTLYIKSSKLLLQDRELSLLPWRELSLSHYYFARASCCGLMVSQRVKILQVFSWMTIFSV